MKGSTYFPQPVDFFCPPRLVDDEDVRITWLSLSKQSFLCLIVKSSSMGHGMGPDPPSTSQVFNGSDDGDMSPNNRSVVSKLDIEYNRRIGGDCDIMSIFCFSSWFSHNRGDFFTPVVGWDGVEWSGVGTGLDR
ncbi:Uncharacterized protein Adt_05377 [Abeliophyllum distichum]|uniref:Uncharacterized protein n=1 Tax=Abeliophyllum distichum TaxID=126358 RepID=A0ABD1V4B1_9LAMI